MPAGTHRKTGVRNITIAFKIKIQIEQDNGEVKNKSSYLLSSLNFSSASTVYTTHISTQYLANYFIFLGLRKKYLIKEIVWYAFFREQGDWFAFFPYGREE